MVEYSQFIRERNRERSAFEMIAKDRMVVGNNLRLKIYPKPLRLNIFDFSLNPYFKGTNLTARARFIKCKPLMRDLFPLTSYCKNSCNFRWMWWIFNTLPPNSYKPKNLIGVYFKKSVIWKIIIFDISFFKCQDWILLTFKEIPWSHTINFLNC